jgi:lipopolysaccharide/colanic/teichoic acid biosynthesis glycosyltransferase
VTLAAVTPFVALYLRDVDLISADGMFVADSFALISFASSLVAFRLFRISSTIPRYLSAGDLLNLAKAVVVSDLMTAMGLFALTRLNGIPRSVPAIHALILGTGLLASRVLASLIARRRHRSINRPPSAGTLSMILIGLNDSSVLLVKFLQAHTPERWRVIALLDEEPHWFGRSVSGVQVYGPPAHLEALVEEFAAHGVRTDRVVIGVGADELSTDAFARIQGTCARRNLDLVFVPDLLGLGSESGGHCANRAADAMLSSSFSTEIQPTPYHSLKRFFDAAAALILILWLLPLLMVAATLVFLDVGSPVLFWQQRAGQGGRKLELYKLRTLRPPFDRRGQRIPEERRVSWVGRLLRQTRTDELPQLLNVLVGDMSLIGPRPLLPQDQPPSSRLRLMIRPGITGWAQVNGGTSLSPTEKEALDIWYIRNASLWVDLRIVGMTFLILLRGERRSEKALAEAQRTLVAQADRSERDARQAMASPFTAATTVPQEDHDRASAVGSC